MDPCCSMFFSSGSVHCLVGRGLFLDYGAQMAFNLDGGGSTTLYFLGEVVNMPSGGKERSVSDVLMFMANPS